MLVGSPKRTIQCCSQVNSGRWCQETYETASRFAGRRAKYLRERGYQVTVSTMGSQVTPLGLIKLTLVDIRPGVHEGTFDLPEVMKVEWPR
jgi:hypothetical protein